MPVAELTPEESAALNEVRECWELSTKDLKPYHDLCMERYGLYRGVKNYRDAWRRGTRRDRDDVAYQAAVDWSSDLHIPLAYSTVETILPRAVANRPRGVVTPLEQQAEENVENMRQLIEIQQGRMGYELLNQDTAKSGFIYGLGAQKLTWRVEQRIQPYLDRATDPAASNAEWVQRQRLSTLWDDPWGEDIDIMDLRWDPAGYGDYSGFGFNLGWIAQSCWRRDDYAIAMIQTGAWNTAVAQSMTPEDIQSSGGEQRRDEAYRDRLAAAGENSSNQGSNRYGRLHEVREYWGPNQVITVLDNAVPVAIRPNPFFHGLKPFFFYRPTTQGMKRLHGIGEIEPIAELIRELNVLRSQRRDNASLVLQQVWAFDEDAIDRDHLVFSPGVAIPTRGGDPASAIHKIEIGDIPYSSYREEDGIKSDADRTTGVSDALSGAEGVTGGAASTATGAQLVAAAANARIENKSRRLELEVVKPFTEQMISLNQQHIIGRTEAFPTMPQPGEMDPKPWQWVKLTPAELNGLMAFAVEGGSMAPKNVAQDAQMGQNLFNALRDNPAVDQDQLVKHFIESQGIKQAGAWLKPPEPTVPLSVLQQIAQKKAYGGDLMKALAYVQNGAQPNG